MALSLTPDGKNIDGSSDIREATALDDNQRRAKTQVVRIGIRVPHQFVFTSFNYR